MDRIRPDRAGNVFDRWNDVMNTKGPPRARRRYPGIYPSNGSLCAVAKSSAPIARQKLPMMPLTRGPYASRMVPTGRAETLVTTAAIVNIRFNLSILEEIPVPRWEGGTYLISCLSHTSTPASSSDFVQRFRYTFSRIRTGLIAANPNTTPAAKKQYTTAVQTWAITGTN
jgi:hypothetical protein